MKIPLTNRKLVSVIALVEEKLMRCMVPGVWTEDVRNVFPIMIERGMVMRST